MPGNDREVFEKLTGGADIPNVEDYLTYALFAFERREWVAHRIAIHKNSPSEQDIETWVGNLTGYQFDQMRRRAAEFFDLAAREYMAGEIELARQNVLKSEVVREVKAAGSFWRQLFIATATAILAPVIIGLIVVAALRSESLIPTITGTQQTVQPKNPD